MITIEEIYKLAGKWYTSQSYRITPRWVMSSEIHDYIKLNLACQCGRPGAIPELHKSTCVSSAPKVLMTLLGWFVRIDESATSLTLEEYKPELPKM